MSSNETQTEKETETTFDFKKYKSLLPENLYKNLSNNGELLILFTNPISGSQQGSIVLSLTEQYKYKEILDFDIIFFQ